MNQINLDISSKQLSDEHNKLQHGLYACSYSAKEHFSSGQSSYQIDVHSGKTQGLFYSQNLDALIHAKKCEELEQQEISSYILNAWVEEHNASQFSNKCIAPKYIKLAEQYISDNICQSPLKIEDIAAYANVSIRTLSSGFKKYRNTSPALFIRDLRLKIVREALISASVNQSIAEIAYACGYVNLGTFIRLYKQKFGELPSTTYRHYVDDYNYMD